MVVLFQKWASLPDCFTVWKLEEPDLQEKTSSKLYSQIANETAKVWATGLSNSIEKPPYLTKSPPRPLNPPPLYPSISSYPTNPWPPPSSDLHPPLHPGRVLCIVLVTIQWAGPPSLIEFHLIDNKRMLILNVISTVYFYFGGIPEFYWRDLRVNTRTGKSSRIPAFLSFHQPLATHT